MPGKRRFELTFGGACVVLVVAAGLGGYYHRHVRALWYRWRFLHCDKIAAKQAADRLYALGAEGNATLRLLVVEDPETELTVLARRPHVVTVRNDRTHRVYVGHPKQLECMAFLGVPAPSEHHDAYARAVRWLMQRSDGARTYVPVIGAGAPAAHDAALPSDSVQAALAWVAAHQEADAAAVAPYRVLDPGESADFWVWP